MIFFFIISAKITIKTECTNDPRPFVGFFRFAGYGLVNLS